MPESGAVLPLLHPTLHRYKMIRLRSVFVLASLLVPAIDSDLIAQNPTTSGHGIQVSYPPETEIYMSPPIIAPPSGGGPTSTQPDVHWIDGDGYNRVYGSLSHENGSDSVDRFGNGFGLNQTSNVVCTLGDELDPEAHATIWCSATADVGGVVTAILTDAVGECAAAGRAKAKLSYGAVVEAEDAAMVAIAEGSSSRIGVTIGFTGVNLTATIGPSTSGSAVSAPIAENDAGSQIQSSFTNIAFSHKGEMSCSIASPIAFPKIIIAKARSTVEIKCHADISFTITFQ